MSEHAEHIAREIQNAKAEREAWESYAREKEEREHRHFELRQRIGAAFEAVLAWPREAHAQGRKPDAAGFLEWARVWVELGRVLRECDTLVHGPIAEFLLKLRGAGVRLPSTVASLLLLSQEGKLEEVAQSLAALYSEPWMLGFGAWLPWIRDELIESEPDARGRVFYAEMPHGTSWEDRETVLRALGYSIFGPGPLASPESSRTPAAAIENKLRVDSGIAAKSGDGEEECSTDTSRLKCKTDRHNSGDSKSAAMADQHAPITGESPVLPYVRNRFVAACQTDACGPFVALVRFSSTPTEADSQIVEKEISIEASRCVWPRVWIATKPGADESLERWAVAGESDALFFVDDRAGRLDRYYPLARFAASRLSTEQIGRLSSQVATDDAWTAFVFRTLGENRLLRDRAVLNGLAKAFWFEGDMFHASLAALDVLLAGTPVAHNPPQLPADKTAGCGTATELTAVERAMQILLRDPSQSNRAIARQVGCDPSLLSKDPRFKRLREAHAGKLPKGCKSKEGDIEAESED